MTSFEEERVIFIKSKFKLTEIVYKHQFFKIYRILLYESLFSRDENSPKLLHSHHE